MGLFGKSDPEKERAKAIAKRGMRARAEIVAMADTGQTRAAAGREYEFTLSFTPEGAAAPLDVTMRQFMNSSVLAGLEPGAPAKISYDRDDPNTVVIWGSPRFAVVEGVVVATPDPEDPDYKPQAS